MKYVIDVTQLVHWSGNLTGIPRVMDELAVRFEKYNKDDVVFVSWVKELGEMCEVDFNKSRRNRGKSIHYVRKWESKATPLSKEEVPKTYDISTADLIKKIAKKTRIDRTLLYKKLKSARYNVKLHSYRTYSPTKNDRFFIPWGEWWDSDWLKKVESYQKMGVLLYPVCHDILPMVVPQFSGNSRSLEYFVSQIFPISRAVITPSQSTKRDLTNWMKARKLPVPKIKTFRLGEDFTVTNADIPDVEMQKKYDIKKDDYLLYVSTIEPRKNHTLLYYVYKLAHSKSLKLPRLLIIGRVGHDTSEIIKFIKSDPEVNQSLVICDYVNDNELNWLYQNCKFTVMPSFYEGWGISVIESIAKGKPVVCSSSSSLLEISDDYLFRFNPASTDECLEAIIKMSDSKTLNKYKKNIKQYKAHSWDGSFKQIVDILKRS